MQRDMIWIDKNKISFESLDIEENARELGLLDPLAGVPTQNAGAYKGVEADTECEEYKEPLVDVKLFGVKSVPYYREQAGNPENKTYKGNIKVLLM